MSEQAVVTKECANPWCKRWFAQTVIFSGARLGNGRNFCTNKCAAQHYRRIHPVTTTVRPLPPVDQGVRILQAAMREHGAASCWQNQSTLERIVRKAMGVNNG